ncbi:potassium-transporting ATPase subunit KdpA [Pseudomonas sp. LFM046]|uniref:potassium-transporting ATPase subunit KdpA n=1 Tax=Pseudomonas sp. LFM046 TaxID=1608357 RepID=UPI0005CFBE72|nr:potassium-transporting ATPase subunit KdpA [Pseudomonas sp. LFM046]
MTGLYVFGALVAAFLRGLLAAALLVRYGPVIAATADTGRIDVATPGSHGYSEIRYLFSSAANNNGNTLAALSAETPFYNSVLGLATWFGRFGVIVPILAIAGSLAAKKRPAPTAGTIPTHSMLFVTPSELQK